MPAACHLTQRMRRPGILYLGVRVHEIISVSVHFTITANYNNQKHIKIKLYHHQNNSKPKIICKSDALTMLLQFAKTYWVTLDTKYLAIKIK